MVRLTLTGPRGSVASRADAELIHDVLWPHMPSAEIAHITTTALPSGIDVAIFLNDDIDDPEQRVVTLVRSAARKSAVLRLWLEGTER